MEGQNLPYKFVLVYRVLEGLAQDQNIERTHSLHHGLQRKSWETTLFKLVHLQGLHFCLLRYIPFGSAVFWLQCHFYKLSSYMNEGYHNIILYIYMSLI